MDSVLSVALVFQSRDRGEGLSIVWKLSVMSVILKPYIIRNGGDFRISEGNGKRLELKWLERKVFAFDSSRNESKKTYEMPTNAYSLQSITQSLLARAKWNLKSNWKQNPGV